MTSMQYLHLRKGLVSVFPSLTSLAVLLSNGELENVIVYFSNESQFVLL